MKNGKPLYMCVLGFDKHNVVDQKVEEEAARFLVLRNMINFNNKLGRALAVISRGTKRWYEVNLREWNQEGDTADGEVRQGYEPRTLFQRCTIFYQVADLLIFTEGMGRDPDRDGPVDVWRYDGMEPNMVCISGDKGDAAQLLGGSGQQRLEI